MYPATLCQRAISMQVLTVSLGTGFLVTYPTPLDIYGCSLPLVTIHTQIATTTRFLKNQSQSPNLICLIL